MEKEPSFLEILGILRGFLLMMKSTNLKLVLLQYTNKKEIQSLFNVIILIFIKNLLDDLQLLQKRIL